MTFIHIIGKLDEQDLSVDTSSNIRQIVTSKCYQYYYTLHQYDARIIAFKHNHSAYQLSDSKFIDYPS